MTTLTLNQQLNGIEIKFDAKPIDATLEELKKLVSAGTTRKKYGTHKAETPHIRASGNRWQLFH